jgi:hypothetical protein
MTAPVAAQAASTDPAAGSPAGTIYQLPLDGARLDAAPPQTAHESPARAAPGSSGATTGPSSKAPTSALRSENGFGSSSTVPGTSGASGAGITGRNGERPGARGSGGASGAGTSGTGGAGGAGGTGASGAAGGIGGIHGSAPATLTSTNVSADNPSDLGVYGLLAFVLVAGAAAGLMTRGRRRPPASS